MKHTPYTYLIGWTKQDKWYYGRRTAKNCDPSELFITYFTSSNYVKRLIVELGAPDVIQVRKTFESTKKCCIWEDKVLRRIKIRSAPKWLNQTNNVMNFGKPNTVVVVDKENNKFCVDLNDPRYLSGELISVNTGKSYGKGIPRNKGKINVKDESGNIIRVDTTDPRYISGELRHHTKGQKMETGWVAAKFKNNRSIKIRVRHDDYRLKTEEIIPVGKYTIQVQMPDGSIKKVEDNDPRLKSGELVECYYRTVNGIRQIYLR